MSTAGRHPLGVRASWLLAALLQLALPGVAAVADARLDAAGSHATAHVESAVCHFLTAPALTARPGALRLAVADGWRLRRADPAGLPHPLARPHPHPRAPPLLS
ncbi:MAG: hypothetical protein DMD34_16455 [Gemmatimonadetes bacterium]|nr:MAG: hypothetical protein DMD34_16455 [Gemmatimonadota bacterium]